MSVSTFHEMVREEALRRAAEEEDRLRAGLGQWVSELEPVLIRRAGDGRLIGIGVEGSGEPVIPL